MNTEQKIQAIKESIEVKTGKKCIVKEKAEKIYFVWVTKRGDALAYSIVKKLLDLLPISSPPENKWISVEEGFVKYMSEERDNFVKWFMRSYPTNEERVMAENLLICFDQMRDKLIK